MLIVGLACKVIYKGHWRDTVKMVVAMTPPKFFYFAFFTLLKKLHLQIFCNFLVQ